MTKIIDKIFGDFEKFSYLCKCYPLGGNKTRIRHFLEHLKSNGLYKPMGSLQVGENFWGWILPKNSRKNGKNTICPP